MARRPFASIPSRDVESAIDAMMPKLQLIFNQRFAPDQPPHVRAIKAEIMTRLMTGIGEPPRWPNVPYTADFVMPVRGDAIVEDPQQEETAVTEDAIDNASESAKSEILALNIWLADLLQHPDDVIARAIRARCGQRLRALES